MRPRRRKSEETSKAILERLEQQSDKTLGPVPKPDRDEKDWTERLGRRLGPILGYGLALYLLWQLLGNYVLR